MPKWKPFGCRSVRNGLENSNRSASPCGSISPPSASVNGWWNAAYFTTSPPYPVRYPIPALAAEFHRQAAAIEILCAQQE